MQAREAAGLRPPAQRLGNELSERARAPHTNGPKDVLRCGALSLLQKPLHYKRGFRSNRAQLLCMWALAQLLPAPLINAQGT
jgi:hypothetical protein